MSLHRLRKPWRSRWITKLILAVLTAGWAWFAFAPSIGGSTQTLLVANRNIVPGEVTQRSDFSEVAVNLGGYALGYLSSSAMPSKTRATRFLLKGQLISKSDLGPVTITSVPLVLTLNSAPASAIVPGSIVDVWATPMRNAQVSDAPFIAVPGAVVTAITQSSSMGSSSTRVQILLEQRFVSDLLMAQANGSMLALVLQPTLRDEN